MRITNVSLSNKFKSKEEVLDVVRRVESEFNESLQDFVTEISFIKSQEPIQASYNKDTRTIEITVKKASNEKVSLAHELIHVMQDIQNRLPQKTVRGFSHAYLIQPHEKQAWIESVRLFGNRKDIKYVKELYSLIKL